MEQSIKIGPQTRNFGKIWISYPKRNEDLILSFSDNFFNLVCSNPAPFNSVYVNIALKTLDAIDLRWHVWNAC